MMEANLPQESHANDDYGREKSATPIRKLADVIMLFLSQCINTRCLAKNKQHLLASRYGMRASSIKTECIPTDHHNYTSYATCLYSQGSLKSEFRANLVSFSAIFEDDTV